MLSFLWRLLFAVPKSSRKQCDVVELPFIARDKISHLLVMIENVPQIDWGMATAWIEHQMKSGEWKGDAENLHRAIAAAWLDELRDALPTDSRRWRTAAIEGLAPLEGTIAARVATTADRSLVVIGEALIKVRGNPKSNPIPPIAIVALDTADEYYSFISHGYPEEGEFATSGGLYIGAVDGTFPILAINAQAKWEVERTVAHELTHHALKPDDATGGYLPMWIEEGLTQMMEEHVTRVSHFVFDHDMLRRHRALWEEIGFDGFVSGDTFHSPQGEEQELSYNLAEALTRHLATSQREQFFAMVRACRNLGADADIAAREHFGHTPQELAEQYIWNR